MAHWQLPKKQCFEKYRSCDKTCKFSDTESTTPWQRYLENLTINDKFINKRVRLFIHQTCALRLKICDSHLTCKVANKCGIKDGPSLPRLSCELSMSVKENPYRKKKEKKSIFEAQIMKKLSNTEAQLKKKRYL